MRMSRERIKSYLRIVFIHSKNRAPKLTRIHYKMQYKINVGFLVILSFAPLIPWKSYQEMDDSMR